jgi:hypothetical protein
MLRALHHVIAGFLRRTWLVAAVTVAICASFAAHAVAALSGDAIAPGEAAPAPGAAPKAAPVAPAPAPRRPAPAGDAFVARNIFCATCPPVRPGGGGGGDAYQGQPAVLIATSLGADPRATVRVVPTEVQGSWGLGEEIPGVGQVNEIHATAIEVADAAGHTKLISLLDGTAAGPGATDAATSNAPPAAARDPFAGRVTKLDDTTYEVERALIRELVMGASRPGMGRAIPRVVNGEVQGISLYGIGPESPGRALGLRSGDLISSIDGEPLKNAQQLIDLFARLDQVASVELGGARASKPFKLTLKLR